MKVEVLDFIELKTLKNVHVYYVLNNGYKNFRKIYEEDLNTIAENGYNIIKNVYTDDLYLIIYREGDKNEVYWYW